MLLLIIDPSICFFRISRLKQSSVSFQLKLTLPAEIIGFNISEKLNCGFVYFLKFIQNDLLSALLVLDKSFRRHWKECVGISICFSWKQNYSSIFVFIIRNICSLLVWNIVWNFAQNTLLLSSNFSLRNQHE